MKELQLKYGCNPNQAYASLSMDCGGELPFTVLNGTPGYINFLDALNAWQLVKELKQALSLPAAASFKHVSPAGAAVGVPLTETEKRILFVDDVEGLDASLLASAYARARGADRMSSFGDFIALSHKCDVATALIIKKEVSDGIIAPSYDEDALELLKSKKGGKYCVIQIDEAYVPQELEHKQVFGVTFTQARNNVKIDMDCLSNAVTIKKDIPMEAKRDLLLGMITLKYTQSNSVCYTCNGQTIGVGAGQQSRIHCTRLAGDKAEIRMLRGCEKVCSLPFRQDVKRPDRDNAIDNYISQNCEELLKAGAWQKLFTSKPQPLTKAEKAEYLAGITGVSLASDAFFPFADNIERAAQSGVSYIVQPGGSKRDQEVIDACDKLGIVMVANGIRLFHH